MSQVESVIEGSQRPRDEASQANSVEDRESPLVEGYSSSASIEPNASGMSTDGGKWTAQESIRFQVRIERTVLAKAHYLLDAMIKAHDTLFTVAKFNDSPETATIARKRPAMVARAGKAIKKLMTKKTKVQTFKKTIKKGQ